MLQGLCVLALGGLKLFYPVYSSAQGQVVDVLSYFLQNTSSSNPISSGEFFSVVDQTGNSFKYQKSQDSRWYEEFQYDSDYIYHVKDTTWATAQGNVIGSDGNEANLMFKDGSFGSYQNTATSYSNQGAAKWLPRYMQVGDTFTTSLTVVGESKATGAIVDTPHTGPVGTQAMKLVYQGPVQLPTGVYSDSAIIIEILSGAGAGERFYYDSEAGWIGFDRGVDGTGAYITTALDPFDPKLKYLEILFALAPEVPPYVQTFQCSVNRDIPLDGEFRPRPCKNCRLTVPKPVNSCATTTTLSHTRRFACAEILSGATLTRYLNLAEQYPDQAQALIQQFFPGLSAEDISYVLRLQCGPDEYVGIDTLWEGTFSLDTTDSKVPFVGYRETKKKDPGNRSENLNQYVNDYFDGTALYDGDPYDASVQAQRNLVWEAGVFRKLAPQQVQDDLRIKLINRSYNYEIEQLPGRKMQDWNTGRYSRTNRNGHLPPDPNDAQYLALYQEWQQTDPWGQYWHYIPMFSREDAPGKATLLLQHDPGDLLPTAAQGVKEGKGVASIPLSVPHLTRTYEVSKALNELLMPEIQAAATSSATGPRQVTAPLTQTDCYPTALGCIPIEASALVSWILRWGTILGGGIAFIIMAWGALLLLTSQGDKKQIEQGRQWFLGGFAGLMLIIFATWLLGLIAGSILQIPGFSQSAFPYAWAQSSEQASQDQSDRFLFNIEPQVNPNGSFKVHLSATQWVGDVGVEVHVDGVKWTNALISGGVHNVGPGYDQEFGSVGSGAWFSGSNTPDLPPGAHEVNFYVTFNGPLPEGFTANNAILSCSVDDTGKSTCQSYDNPIEQPPVQCGNPNQYSPPQCRLFGVEDPNPDLDSTCCTQGIQTVVPFYVNKFDREDYLRACTSPYCDAVANNDVPNCSGISATERRDMGVKLQLPYLQEIWKYTAAEKTGVFQIFNPQRLITFPDEAAKSGIKYTFTGENNSVSPEEGDIFFPHLYGVQKSKKCVSEVLLTPKELQDPNGAQEWCDLTDQQVEQVTSGFGSQL